MTPILHTLQSGGSPHGLSNARRYLNCPKSASLYEADDTPQGPLTWGGAAVGTVGHALLEMHFGEALPAEADPFNTVHFEQEQEGVVLQHSDLMEERVWVEASRLFTAFREYAPELDIFGKVVGVEVELGGEEVSAAVGINPFTCRLDLVAKMTKRHIERLKKRFTMDGALEALQPGIWLVDHKHFARRDANLLDKALWSHQFTSQQLAWNAANPKTPCMGVIQNAIFKTKEVKFGLTVVPPPTKHHILRLGALLDQIKHIREHRSEVAIPNESNCFSFFGTCRWLKEGMCRGY